MKTNGKIALLAKPIQRGTLGRLIKLVANHYKVGLKNTKFKMFQYDVTLERASESQFAGAKKEDKDGDFKNKDAVK